ncbi:aminotransferase class V-fold PLP-dependent enzyme [Sphingomonas sp. NCPPB 2930]
MLDPAILRAAMPASTTGHYFNNAGASLMPQAVVDAVTGHLARESARGAYGAAQDQAGAVEDVYRSAARLLGCDADEIALTDSHSRGWQAVIAAMGLKRGDRILVGRSEWGGNYAALLHIARATGATVQQVGCEADGTIDLDDLAYNLDASVRLVSLTWLPANGGLVNPAAAVGALTRAAGVPFVLDAAQAVGQMPVDVRALGCDVLTAPGRKWLRGPRGTGLLYLRRGFLPALHPPTVDHFTAPWNGTEYVLRSDARRFEVSEASVALRLGLGVALDAAMALGVDGIRHAIGARATQLREGLARIDGVRLRDLGTVQSGLVSFTVERMAPAQVQTQLAARGMVLAVNGMAYTPLDMRARGLHEIVRASPHAYTTADEVDELLAAVQGLVAGRSLGT